LIILTLGVLLYVLIARWVDRRPWRDYGLHLSAAWWRDLGFGLFLGLGLMSVVFGFEYLLGWVTIQGLIENSKPALPFWQLFANSLLAYLLVGVQEEFFFRGFIIKNLAEGLHISHIRSKAAVWVSYLLLSLLFGFAHIGNANATLVSTTNLCLVGLLMGLGFILTGELAISIGLHITWNFAQGCIFGFPVSGSDTQFSLLAVKQLGPTIWTGGAFGPEGGLLILAVALLGILLIYTWVWRTRGRVAAREELAEYLPLHPEAGTI
jgi:membrane protease YdiL (CAAX protease family)